MKKVMTYAALVTMVAATPAIVMPAPAEAASSYAPAKVYYKVGTGHAEFPFKSLGGLIAAGIPGASSVAYLATENNNMYNMKDFSAYFAANPNASVENILENLERLNKNLTPAQIAALAITVGKVENQQITGGGAVVTPVEEEFKVISIE